MKLWFTQLKHLPAFHVKDYFLIWHIFKEQPKEDINFHRGEEVSETVYRGRPVESQGRGLCWAGAGNAFLAPAPEGSQGLLKVSSPLCSKCASYF